MSPKGGVGKSTICASLAVAAVARRKRVGLVDLDPQQSLAGWYRRRPDKTRMLMSEGTFDPEEAAQSLSDCDVILLDCPPSQMKVLAAATACADYVVIPLRAGTFDVEALQTAIDLCDEAGVEFGMLLNDVRSNEGTYRATVEFLLENELPVIEGALAHRVSHAYAVAHGLAASEAIAGRLDQAAKHDVDVLWADVWKRALAAAGARS